MVMDNICCVLNNFLHCSAYDHVIFCWVLHRQALLDGLRSRLAGDIRAGRRTPDVTERSLRRLPLYAALDTRKIDVSPLSPEETAAEIVREAET